MTKLTLITSYRQKMKAMKEATAKADERSSSSIAHCGVTEHWVGAAGIKRRRRRAVNGRMLFLRAIVG